MAKVLLAEDSPTQVVLLKALLEEDAHEVCIAGDGQTAMEMVAQDCPDVVVTDMQMPRMNGLELVRSLREGYPHLPAILITAQGSEELSAQALKEGAAAYLPKSTTSEELLAVVGHVLTLMEEEISYANLIDCLEYHEFQFALKNDPCLISPLVHFMQQMAAGMQFCDEVTRARIGMALEQAILNALYRGNLEIDRQQQTDDEEIQVEGEPSLAQQRMSTPPYCDRQIHVHAHLGTDRIEFTVRDDGPGFDVSTVSPPLERESFDDTDGRGLVLIQSFMDEVIFNDRGNEIRMIKRI